MTPNFTVLGTGGIQCQYMSGRRVRHCCCMLNHTHMHKEQLKIEKYGATGARTHVRSYGGGNS